jgi:uracil-DNA glycosylase
MPENQASSKTAAPASELQRLELLHREILGCRRCADAGLLQTCAPVLAAPEVSRVVLVGQAPGSVEQVSGLPFSGRAGRQLFRWLALAGIGDEESARSTIYLTSITKCFPGRAPAQRGDRRPSATEVELCSGHLEAQLGILRPRLILAVGQLAITRFLGNRPLSGLIGSVFDMAGREIEPEAGRLLLPGDGALILPLPHPSGASRWLNAADHRQQLEAALSLLRELLRPFRTPLTAGRTCV